MDGKVLAKCLLILRKDKENILRLGALAASRMAASEMKDDVKEHRGREYEAYNVERGESTWTRDYLVDSSIFTNAMFRRHFRIPIKIFYRVHAELKEEYPVVFEKKKSASGKMGHRSEMKILVALLQFGMGRSKDDLDDLSRMGEEIIRQYCFLFCEKMIEIYGREYFYRRPTMKELQNL